MKVYWHPGEAIVAAIVATVGTVMIYLANPVFHPLAYAIGWLFIAGLIYQTGCEYYERRLSRQRRPADQTKS